MGAPKGKCGNRGMQTRLESSHKDLHEEVRSAQAAVADAARFVKVDPKNETVRGTIPIFQLKNNRDRKEFLKLVHSVFFICFYALVQVFPDGPSNFTNEEKRKRELDWGVLSMIVLDFEPFNVVNRCFT